MPGTEEIIILIEKPLYGGYGMGRVSGKAVFVPCALPGETVRAAVISVHADYLVAEKKEIIESSIHRIEPECPNFGRCGGCAYLHCDYPFELDQKKIIVADALRRIAGFMIDPGAVEGLRGDRFHYRTHCDVKFSRGRPGFHMTRSNTVVPFPEKGCLLLPDELREAVRSLSMMEGSSRIAVDHKGGVHVQGDGSTVREREKGIIYDRGIGDFFQVNRFLRGIMLEEVLKKSELDPKESFVDIGCGVGFFSLYMAARSSGGIGIDRSKSSIRRAEQNAGLNGLKNLSFYAMDAGDINPEQLGVDVAVLDPPRAGLGKSTRRALIAMLPERIVYVSCNPATFARDIRDFFMAGYSLGGLTMIDMFPGTSHIEVIGQLKKR